LKNITPQYNVNWGSRFSEVSETIRWIKEISERWQKAWESSRVYDADPDEKRSKYFVTAAFPYPNSPVHIGNARSYLLADIVARHRRTKGDNVLYPMGFHYTGTPILSMAESIEAGDPELIDLFVSLYGVPREIATSLSKPLDLAQYFHRVSRDSMKMLGLGIDWRREFTTIDPYFSSFIRWQFEILREKGYLVKGTYPVGWCPKHEMPVGGHDTKDDKDPEIGEFTIIFFRDSEGRILPTATLRPETIFGVTNLWINPYAEYIEIEINKTKWIVSRKGFEKLRYQKKDVRIVKAVGIDELLSKQAINPVTGEAVPILPARFVDPEIGTGVVMSVPAHSPDDYVAYIEITRSDSSVKPLEPRIVIKIPGIKDIPAKFFVEKHRVRSQLDRGSLDRATKELYSLEYSSGTMVDDLERLVYSPRDRGFLEGFIRGWISGKSVPEARENISRILRLSGYGDVLYEIMNKPVYCRCGTEIVVKILENQWFINYSDPRWKEKGLELLNSMYIQPPEIKTYMADLIKALREKPCARTRGLGTPLPWDPRWVIESLSDSTIYMAFYTVAHRIRSLVRDPSLLDRDFWDYLLLGKGPLNVIASKTGLRPEDLEDLRKEFLYWYPLDLRVAGKDLSNNHLLFFIMNHVAIFPKDLWPRSMIVHGWMLRDGRKMSKSYRNILPLFKAIEIYGSDTVRVAISTLSEVGQDLDFRHESVVNISDHFRRIYDIVSKIVESRVKKDPGEVDRVYASMIARDIIKADEALEKLRIRDAGVRLIYSMANEMSNYIQSVDAVWSDMLDLVRAWIIMLSIYIPHIAEEIWHRLLDEKSFVVKEVFDRNMIRKYIDDQAEFRYRYIKALRSDIEEIMALLKRKPSRVVVYVAPKDEIEILRRSIEAHRRGEGLKAIMEKHIDRIPGVGREEAAQRIKRIFDHASSIPEDLSEIIMSIQDIDEARIIRENIDSLRDLTGSSEILVYISSDPEAPDYRGKKREALPLRPGIYME
jgi:leucyl-tRNA synthetase